MRPEIIQTMVEGRTYVITLNKKLLFNSGGHQYYCTGILRDFILSKDDTVVGIRIDTDVGVHMCTVLLPTDSIDYIIETPL